MLPAGLKDCGARFLSRTNLGALDVIDREKAGLEMPVLSRNQMLAWHPCSLVGNRNTLFAPGCQWRR
jgi:maleate cis-trans isomerase